MFMMMIPIKRLKTQVPVVGRVLWSCAAASDSGPAGHKIKACIASRGSRQVPRVRSTRRPVKSDFRSSELHGAASGRRTDGHTSRGSGRARAAPYMQLRRLNGAHCMRRNHQFSCCWSGDPTLPGVAQKRRASGKWRHSGADPGISVREPVLPLSFTSPSSPFSPFTPLLSPLEVSPLKPARASGGALEVSNRGPSQEVWEGSPLPQKLKQNVKLV